MFIMLVGLIESINNDLGVREAVFTKQTGLLIKFFCTNEWAPSGWWNLFLNSTVVQQKLRRYYQKFGRFSFRDYFCERKGLIDIRFFIYFGYIISIRAQGLLIQAHANNLIVLKYLIRGVTGNLKISASRN